MADTNELENERDGLRLQLGEAQTRLDTVEAARKKAEERIVALEKEALSAKVNALVSFIQSYRDKDGNAHPAQLATWAGHVLRFENLGEGDGVVHLEEDYRPAPAVVDYLVGAIKELVTTMPGIVPLERVTQDGSDKKGGEGDDDFDYAKEWNK